MLVTLGCHTIDHQLVDTDLLVDTGDHDSLINGLIASADEIMIEVHVHIVHFLNVRERYEGKKIVHIKGVLRQM